MDSILQVSGIIIKVMPAGDYDKRITILTKERGRMTAFARGARRQGSALMGVTRVFASGKFRVREGKDAYSLYSAQIDNYFDGLASDLGKSCFGMYFLEMADYYSREGMSDPELIRLLYLSLVALTRPSLPDGLVRRIFELRSMVISGEYLPEPPGTGEEGCRFTWRYICTTPLEKLYTFTISAEIYEQLVKSVDICLKKFIDKKMKSLEMLEML